MKKIILFIAVMLTTGLVVNAQSASTVFFNSNGNGEPLPAVASNFDNPINVAGFDASSMPGGVSALVIYLEFDNVVLSYVGYTPNTGFDYTVGVINDTVVKVEVFDWTNGVFNVRDGKLLDLQFTYNGGYSTTIFGDATPYQTVYSDAVTFLEVPITNLTNGAVGDANNTISGGDWDVASNWSMGMIPTEDHVVTVDGGVETTASSNAEAYSVTIALDGQLTLTSSLNVIGDFLIQSDATGDGSFINNGGTLNVGGTTTVERYAVNGQWHGLSSPVMGAKFDVTYFGGNPEVWVKKYNEPTDDYTYLVDTTALMGDMTGYFTWIQTSGSPLVYNFEGDLRTGTISSPVLNKTNTGHAFLGNPFTSAIDWDAPSGWSKFQLYDAIYVYDGAAGQFMSYVAGLGSNGGSQYIPMGQGFFVQVDNSFTFGSVNMNNDVCVHNGVAFKDASANKDVVRLQVEDAGSVDETVIRFTEEATAEFDGNLDAAKLFSFNNEYPQLYSTANDFMSINSVPYGTQSVALDVKGKEGNTLTISATEAEGFEFLNLKDNNTGVTTNLKSESYTFTYNSNVTDRFELFFGFTGIDNTTSVDYAKIYAVDNNVKVVLDNGVNADITVYNLLGQSVAARSASGTITTIAVEKTGYYLVKVNDGAHVTTQKVFIR